MKNTKKFQAKNKGVRAWVCVYVCFFHPRYQGQFYVSFFFLSIIDPRPGKLAMRKHRRNI